MFLLKILGIMFLDQVSYWSFVPVSVSIGRNIEELKKLQFLPAAR